MRKMINKILDRLFLALLKRELKQMDQYHFQKVIVRSHGNQEYYIGMGLSPQAFGFSEDSEYKWATQEID